MSRTFSSSFTHYLVPSERAVKTALTTGMVVFDTNVLLSAYRFAPQAREQLLSTMDQLKDRVWVPHRVGLEFHRRRLDVIAEQRAAYETVLGLIVKHKSELSKEIGDSIRQLSNRAALTGQDRLALLGQLEDGLEPLRKMVERLNDDHSAIEIHDDDPILLRLHSIIGENIGEDFPAEARKDALQEAERRKVARIPPGFKDADKPEFYGDYFLWRQTLDEAKRRSAQHLVFVTNDQKDDWYLKVKGKHIADPQLAQEARDFCNAQLVLMSTQTLLHHARKYLNADVSNETIRQAGELREIESAREDLAALATWMRTAEEALKISKSEMAALYDRLQALQARAYGLQTGLSDVSPMEANRRHAMLERINTEHERVVAQIALKERELVDLEGTILSAREKLIHLRHQLGEPGPNSPGYKGE
ncbi:PIN domain-containing protein [Micromonospora sp. NPDC051196]|uniref:PIN-like domain-containing protein n=1 Tax=Micromonospora sp. NPDC051196 TaxID=3155281 RepID=UPI00344740F2